MLRYLKGEIFWGQGTQQLGPGPRLKDLPCLSCIYGPHRKGLKESCRGLDPLLGVYPALTHAFTEGVACHMRTNNYLLDHEPHSTFGAEACVRVLPISFTGPGADVRASEKTLFSGFGLQGSRAARGAPQMSSLGPLFSPSLVFLGIPQRQPDPVSTGAAKSSYQNNSCFHST